MVDESIGRLTATAESAGHVIDVVRGYLGQHFAERTTRHGVFMDILGLGVLLTGESGTGKELLAAQKGNKIATAYRVPVDAAFEEK